MIIAHNLVAMNAQRQYNINAKSKAKSTEKLSSGYRINRAADDAAGLAISEKMRRMIRGLKQGAENTMDGISFVQVGDGAMEEIHDMVHRMTELSVKASNGTLTEDDRNYIDQEVQALKKEINRVAQSTTFNEIPIFDNNTVVFGLEGSPNDLQIFNASYDSNGNLASYGGFLFHGERITWDMIDANMIEVDPNTNKQVFNKGEYSYTSDNTGYSFEFHCKDGDVPPIITRDISIEADANGIVLNKERFDWSKVYDLDGNTCSPSNLHAGPWAIDFYGAKFVFTVSEPVEDLEGLASDVDACKSSTVYYNWEVNYSVGGTERAVDAYGVGIEDRKVTQTTVNNMLNSSQNGLRMVVNADENGIWLTNKDGIELQDSKKTWEQLGIQSWEEGMIVPDFNNGTEVTYTYENASTGLKFEFSLSDITSKDSVIDGLNGMIVTGTPNNVSYEPVASVSGDPSVLGISCHKTLLNLSFEEEVDIGRNFDTEKWSTTSQAFTYNNTNGYNRIDVTFDGGVAMLGDARYGEPNMRTVMIDYMNWVKAEKTQAILEGKSTDIVSFDNYLGTKRDDIYLHLRKGSSQIELTYDYDYSNVLKELTDNVNVQMVNVATTGIASNWYIQNADGSYTASDVYRDQVFSQIDADDSLTEEEKEQEKQTKLTEIEDLNKYMFDIDYYGVDNTTMVYSTSAVSDTVIPQICRQLANCTELTITSQDYSRVTMSGNELNNYASRPDYIAVMKETPIEPDIYIVHSSEENDRTGIPRFAMTTTAMGLAFGDCTTVESANQLLSSTKNALAYVSSKRSIYGALQNRLEHTYNNNQNISENMTAAESAIRDADMAKEMVKYSKDNILEQVGHAMMAQANQSNQGVLTLLNQ